MTGLVSSVTVYVGGGEEHGTTWARGSIDGWSCWYAPITNSRWQRGKKRMRRELAHSRLGDPATAGVAAGRI